MTDLNPRLLPFIKVLYQDQVIPKLIERACWIRTKTLIASTIAEYKDLDSAEPGLQVDKATRADPIHIVLSSPPGIGKTISLMQIAQCVLERNFLHECCIHMLVYVAPVKIAPIFEDKPRRMTFDTYLSGSDTHPNQTTVIVYWRSNQPASADPERTHHDEPDLFQKASILVSKHGAMEDYLTSFISSHIKETNFKCKNQNCIGLRLFDPTEKCKLVLKSEFSYIGKMHWFSIDAVSGGFVRRRNQNFSLDHKLFTFGQFGKICKNAIMLPVWDEKELQEMIVKNYADIKYRNLREASAQVVQDLLYYVNGRVRPLLKVIESLFLKSQYRSNTDSEAVTRRQHAVDLPTKADIINHCSEEFKAEADKISTYSAGNEAVRFLLSFYATPSKTPDDTVRSDEAIFPVECLQSSSPMKRTEYVPKFVLATNYISLKAMNKMKTVMLKQILADMDSVEGRLMEYSVLSALSGHHSSGVSPWEELMKKAFDLIKEKETVLHLAIPTKENDKNHLVKYTRPDHGNGNGNFNLELPAKLEQNQLYRVSESTPEIDGFIFVSSNGKKYVHLLQVTRNKTSHTCNVRRLASYCNQIKNAISPKARVSFSLLYLWHRDYWESFTLKVNNRKIQENEKRKLSESFATGVFLVDMSFLKLDSALSHPHSSPAPTATQAPILQASSPPATTPTRAVKSEPRGSRKRRSTPQEKAVNKMHKTSHHDSSF